MSNVSNIEKRRKSALSEGGAEYAAKREELIRIAARLFKELGYKETRLADIAKEAGLDRATVYYYVGSKEVLFREVVEGVVDANIAEAERLLAVPGLNWAERLMLITERLMLSYEENYPYTYVYIQELMHQVSSDQSPWAQELLKKTKRFETIVMSFIREGVAAGELRKDIPVRLTANALFGMFNWTSRWYAPGGTFKAKEIAQRFWQIFFEGMKVSKR